MKKINELIIFNNRINEDLINVIISKDYIECGYVLFKLDKHDVCNTNKILEDIVLNIHNKLIIEITPGFINNLINGISNGNLALGILIKDIFTLLIKYDVDFVITTSVKHITTIFMFDTVKMYTLNNRISNGYKNIYKVKINTVRDKYNNTKYRINSYTVKKPYFTITSGMLYRRKNK